MAASMVPPPVLQSTHASPPSALTRSVLVDPPSPVRDRQGELEADLQFLLDAQAGALVRGLEAGLHDDQISNGSTTPTAQSVRSASRRPHRPPSRKMPGLKSARKGIYNAMLALSTLKDEELADVRDEARESERKLGQIDEWEVKRGGLHEAIRAVDADEDTIRAQRLHQEANVLQAEINSVEMHLADLRARHRKLAKQAAAVENSVQAKLASYTSSLRLLEETVQKLLSLEPSETTAQTTPQNGGKSMWQLPPKRRTLEMAKEQWTAEQRSSLQRQESIEHEKSALDEGAAIWKDVVAQVTHFERRLRAEVLKMSESSSASRNTPIEQQSSELEALMQDLAAVMQTLESSLELAKTRNWNLLIAAIGAELDALTRGKQMLETMCNPSIAPPNDDTASNPGDEIHDLDKSFRTATRRVSNDGDSDPDPELMFSVHASND